MTDYRPLTKFLSTRDAGEVPMTFREIEQVLGQPLPNSARRHQAWWANTPSHSHAQAWMSGGWRTARVDLGSQRLVFVRDLPVSTSAAYVQEDSTPFQSVPRPGEGESRKPAGERWTVELDGLSAGALRLIDDYTEALGGARSAAVARIIEEAALERRRRLLDRFAVAPAVRGDSTALIREDRDAR